MRYHHQALCASWLGLLGALTLNQTSRNVAQAFVFDRLDSSDNNNWSYLEPKNSPSTSPESYNRRTITSQPYHYQYQSRRQQFRRQPTNRAHTQTDLYQQASPDEQHIPAIGSTTTRDLIQFGRDEPDERSCPTECDCDLKAQIADCSNRKLTKVPIGFPKDIKRIKLERNNISELGPYAFEGLKRLQRIDLANNNLRRIDPLAFAGGLQSLNALILFSNKLTELPVNLFSELRQLQLLLLNANSLQCVNKESFQQLGNLNLLSLYDNKIETLANGTFDGLKNIRTIHLGKNPLVCDCNLRWLADFLERNPGVETSEAHCEGPHRNSGSKVRDTNKQRFICEANEPARLVPLCGAPAHQVLAANQNGPNRNECPDGCICNGPRVDCSSRAQSQSVETKGGIYEMVPDIPKDIPIYVTQMRINDTRIKRIRQTGLFKRLTNSQKLDLGNNRIVDIEDNAIGGSPGQGSSRPERVVFVLIENESCSAPSATSLSPGGGKDLSRGGESLYSPENLQPENRDPCQLAPKVNSPNFDSPCYNGGSCVVSSHHQQVSSRSQGPVNQFANFNYSCACPPGFAGPLCEVNIDDCVDHQCQNGGQCVDGVNSYRCICRDPTTSGEFCEQLASSSSSATNFGSTYVSSAANSINAPIALPMVSQVSSPLVAGLQQDSSSVIQTRSADSFGQPMSLASGSCRRITERRYYDDGNGCQSVRMLKLSVCQGTCSAQGGQLSTTPNSPSCCSSSHVKKRRIRMQCSDGASYVKTVALVKKCSCRSECNSIDTNYGPYLHNNMTIDGQDDGANTKMDIAA